MDGRDGMIVNCYELKGLGPPRGRMQKNPSFVLQQMQQQGGCWRPASLLPVMVAAVIAAAAHQLAADHLAGRWDVRLGP
jgi:hypothetical protein